MILLQRVIFQEVAAAFLIILTTLVGVVWTTQILRQLDLVTIKGQSLFQFLKITALALPLFINLVIPFAFCFALIFVLNRLSATHKLIIMAAAGMSRRALFSPVFFLALGLSLVVFVLSVYIAPQGLRLFRYEITQVRVNLLAQLIKPGHFVSLDQGIVFYVQTRETDGSLSHVFLQDTRDETYIYTYTARKGYIFETLKRALLIMTDGTIQRQSLETKDISLVAYDSYAFDLTNMMPETTQVAYKLKEQRLTDLLSQQAHGTGKEKDAIRLEIHKRFSSGLYPLAFAIIVFLFLGRVRTTRQGRSIATVSSILCCFLLWGAGLIMGLLLSARIPLVLYVPPLMTYLFGLPLLLAEGSSSDMRMMNDEL